MNRALLTQHKDQTLSDLRLAHFDSYVEYIDSLVDKRDYAGLRSKVFARAVASLGFR